MGAGPVAPAAAAIDRAPAPRPPHDPERDSLGPADALLLAGWLRGRLGRDIELEDEPAGEVELVEVDGKAVEAQRAGEKSASDLLSDQLEVFGRDPIYEEAVRSFSRVPT